MSDIDEGDRLGEEELDMTTPKSTFFNLMSYEDKDLDRLATQILEEKNRRLQAIRETKLKKCQEFANSLTREKIDILAPEHGRTSCSDDNVCNGWHSGRNHFRCVRCWLLDMLESGFFGDSPFTYYLSVSFDPPVNP
jgi:hypothetical protein